MMIVDGKAIAEKLYEVMRKEVSERSSVPKLSIITCAPNFETKKYLALKERKAESVGIITEVIELDATQTTEEFIATIESLLPTTQGIIVQLPLPPHVDTDAVLGTIPPSHDVDALNPKTTAVLSPVVGAFREILKDYEATAFEKYVTVIGSGRLVGLPAYNWFVSQGAFVSIVTRDTVDIEGYTKNADIVVCGAGVPGLLTPEMVKDGVIILDAGTSEDGGMLRGDALPTCSEKALIFTPVPGGIGPITIAVLLHNLIVLSRA